MSCLFHTVLSVSCPVRNFIEQITNRAPGPLTQCDHGYQGHGLRPKHKPRSNNNNTTRPYVFVCVCVIACVLREKEEKNNKKNGLIKHQRRRTMRRRTAFPPNVRLAITFIRPKVVVYYSRYRRRPSSVCLNVKTTWSDDDDILTIEMCLGTFRCIAYTHAFFRSSVWWCLCECVCMVESGGRETR